MADTIGIGIIYRYFDLGYQVLVSVDLMSWHCYWYHALRLKHRYYYQYRYRSSLLDFSFTDTYLINFDL